MRIIFCLMVFLFIGKNTMLAQQLSSFVEYGTTLHTGDNTLFGRSATSKDSLRSTTILTYVEEYPTNTNLENGSLKKHWIWLQQPDSARPPSLYSRLT